MEIDLGKSRNDRETHLRRRGSCGAGVGIGLCLADRTARILHELLPLAVGLLELAL
jgi:hypothetical protein